MLKTTTTLLLTIGFLIRLSAQCDFNNTVFQANETVNYEIYYNWGFIWLNAGEAEFTVSEKEIDSKNAYVLQSSGSSYTNYDWIYKVRDQFESVIDAETFSPMSFSRQTSEGGYIVDNKYVYNVEDSSIYSNTWNNESEKRIIDTLANDGCTFDVLSSIYACRTIDFNNKKVLDTVPLKMVIDGEVFELYIRYLGKETIINRDKRQFNTNKFSVMLVEGTIFKGGEDMTVWVSDDKNQIPVYIEAKILVGSIKAMVSDIKGNKWPVDYETGANNP